jgi:hypothetical protein
LSEAIGLDATIPLESIDCVLGLREVYDKLLDDGWEEEVNSVV